MTSELSHFAAQLRGLIQLDSLGAAGSAAEDFSFNSLALELFRLQFAHNSPYRRLAEARAAVPGSITHWRQVPAVPTSAFKDFEFSCLPPGQRTRVFHSSGTTAQTPSRHFHSAQSVELYQVAALTDFRRRVAPDFESKRMNSTWVILTPAPGQAPHSSLVHMFETIRVSFDVPASCFLGRLDREGSWSVDVERVLRRLSESTNEGRPVYLLGTAFLFVHLLDDMARQGLSFRLPPGSRIFETGGYKGRSRTVPKSELRALFRSRLGIPESEVISEYGMSELSSQAYESRMADGGLRNGRADAPGEGRVFQFPPWVRWQIISPEDGREVVPGETGLLRVFDLANVFSVMAIQTEDLAVRQEGGFELIGRAEGSEPRGCSLMAAGAFGTPQYAIRTPHS